MNQPQIATRFTGSRPTITIYDTALVQTDRRLAHFNEGIRSLLSPTESSALDSRPGDGFDAYIRNIAFGPVGITEYRTAPLRDVRTPRMIRSNPDEDFFLLRLMTGGGSLSQSQNQTQLNAGDVVLYDSAREFIWEFGCASTMQIARIPRQLLLKKASHAETLVAKKIPSTSPFGTMVGSIFEGALAFSDFDEDFDVVRYGHSITDMISTCLELGLNKSTAASRTEDLVHRAQKILLRNLDNPEFDFASLSTCLNASPRTICRAFTSEGTTAIRWLWTKRLEQAYELATSGTTLNVSQIAIRCGYSDFAHFSRSFKSAFGISPSALLAQTRSPS